MQYNFDTVTNGITNDEETALNTILDTYFKPLSKDECHWEDIDVQRYRQGWFNNLIGVLN